MEQTIDSIENRAIPGVTAKLVTLLLASTISIVLSVAACYFGLKMDIGDVRASQQSEARVNNIRIGLLEQEVSLLQQQMKEIKNK